MRILVCGGRDFGDRDFLFGTLDRLHRERGFTVLIEGVARGADQLAVEWADARAIEHLRFPADWERHRRRAGPLRNKQMLDEGKPDLVVAFPGGTGTANMIGQAQAAGVETLVIVSDR